MEELDKHLIFLSKRVSNPKFKRGKSFSKPFRKESQSNKNFVDKSKFKCYITGIVGHFSNECRKPKVDTEEKSTEAVDYKKKYFEM